MLVAAVVFPFTEIAVLLFGIIIFCIALHFFLETRRSLQEALASRDKANLFTPFPGINYRKEVVAPKGKKKAAAPAPVQPLFNRRKNNPDVIPSLHETVLLRQKNAASFAEERQRTKENEQLHNEIRQLEKMLEKKEEALQTARQEAAMVQQLENRIEELHNELEWMENKMAGLEKEAAHSTGMAMELEDGKTLIEQQQYELNKAAEKGEQAALENEHLRRQLGEAEDKLAEANRQRKQLQKKVELMQEVNDDLQNAADANKKFKTDLRRIGELESMLNIIQEERSFSGKSKFK